MLLESKNAISGLGSYLHDGIISLDPVDGVIIDLTAPAARILGRPESELVGTTIRSLLGTSLSADAWRRLLDEITDKGALTVTSSVSRPDGTTTPVELSFVMEEHDHPYAGPAAGTDGLRIFAVCHDLSELALANSRTVESNQLLNAALSAVEDGIAVIGVDGVIQHVNDGFEKIVDRPFDQIVGRSIFDIPWRWLDASGTPLARASHPEVIAIETGEPLYMRGLRISGLGHRRSNGEVRSVDVRIEPLADQSGPARSFVMVIVDQTEHLRVEQRLEELRTTDPLTGLMTRARTVERLVELSMPRNATGSRVGHVGTTTHSQFGDPLPTGPAGHGDEPDAVTEPPTRIGVLHVDLDDFRSVNDTFGTGVGDFVLTELSDRFFDLGFRHVEIGRIGVDEFLFITTGTGSSLNFDAKIQRLAEEVQRRIETPMVHQGVELRFTSAIGISRSHLGTMDPDELLRSADAARRASRREGRNRIRLYDATIDETIRSGLTLDRDLRRAAAQREMEVHYQPIIDLRTGSVAAAEALVRWTHPERGPIPPSVFIPSAEATGAISSISDMVLSTVAEDLADWNIRGVIPSETRISINVSAGEFEMKGFVDRLTREIENAGLSPSQLELELTESLLMRDMDNTAAKLRVLHDLGFLVALDDFGTGYSSLSYLHSLPLHTLKVDRRFVTDLGNGRSETITRSILSLAQGLGIGTVAEGVETDVQRDFLIREGCDMVQGFFYSPPMPKTTFERFIEPFRTRQPR